MVEVGRVNDLLVQFRKFLLEELVPFEQANGVPALADPDAAVGITRQVRKLARAAGWYGINLPVEYGGRGLSLYGLAVLQQELRRSGVTLGSYVLGDYGGPLRAGEILLRANEDQKQRYLAPLAAGDLTCCFALTEPQAGSDAGNLQTTAVQQGDHYVLNGVKHFASYASYADFAIVLAMTDPAMGSPDGISAFVVERSTPGYRVGPPQVAINGETITAQIFLQDCRVPTANRLGAEGQGFRWAMARITQNRVLNAAAFVGMAARALDLARAYAAERTQFKRRIGDFQAIQHMLADMATDLYACECMIAEATRAIDRGEDVRQRASMVKLFSSEAVGRIVDRALQIHGGVGLLQGHPVERLYRHARMWRILTGSSEIQRNTIAREVLRHPSATKGET